MKHQAAPFRAEVPKLPADATDEEFDAWMDALPPCPGLPETPEEIATADAEAMADYAAGRVYDHSIVAEWLKTWGTSDRRSFQDWFASRNA